jgi:hypothetical protein
VRIIEDSVTNKGISMGKVGIWIDHRRAVIVELTGDGESIKTIKTEDKMTEPQMVAKVRAHFLK